MDERLAAFATGGPLAGRVVLVTGASRGLGRAIACALAAAGADVALAARDASGLEATAAAVSELGVRAVPIPTDVTDSAAVDRLVATTVSELGGLDVLVNNSGIVRERPLLEVSDAEWDEVISTNLRGTFFCTRAAGRHMVDRRQGKIVNIASNLGLFVIPYHASYCASKAAIIQFTRAVAAEWARYGIQANAIAPGYVETEMNVELRRDADLLGRMLKRVPARRMGSPDEVGSLAVYLASSASDFITGETIVIDGGQAVV